jgi:hypothetical protein
MTIVTFKEAIKSKQSIRIIKENLKSIIENGYDHKCDITRKIYDKFISMITNKKVLCNVTIYDIKLLFHIYIPTSEQLNCLIDNAQRDINIIHTDEWLTYLESNGYVFTDDQIKIFVRCNSIEFLVYRLVHIKNNPCDELINVIKYIPLDIIKKNISSLNITKKYRQQITDDDIFNVCVALYEKEEVYFNLVSLLIDDFKFEQHIVIKLFEYMLKSEHGCKLKYLNDMYDKFKHLINLTDDIVKMFINKCNISHRCLYGTHVYVDSLKILSEMINKIQIYEIVMNTLIFNNLIFDSEYVSIYRDLIRHAQNNNIACTLITFSFACKTRNSILINKCIEQNIIPTNEQLLCAICIKSVYLFDHCQKHIKLNIEHLCYACYYYHSIITQKILNAKIIPTTTCFVNVLNNKNVVKIDEKIITTLIEHGGIINKTILSHMIINNVMFPNIFNYGVTHNDYFEICHNYCLNYNSLDYITFNTPHKILYEMINNIDNSFLHNEYDYDYEHSNHNKQHNDIIHFKELHNIDFDKYCYDLLLLLDGAPFNTIIKDAIKNKKYVPTTEAIVRETNIIRKQNLLKKYNFNASFNL